MDFKNLGSSAMGVAYTAGGAIAAGFARKKIAFLDTVIGKILLIALGIYIVSQSKSEILKGVGTGVALNGAMGFASGLLGIGEGVNGTDGVGSVVQDENGMVYLMNGVGEIIPYEIPLVEGVGETVYLDTEQFSGVNGNADATAIA